ncbi:MAG TPA: DUF1214 domain-containing protein [Acidimicrobiia bacterium]|nr:DUF1214 domain-containing protein [Acidimicrobiia bacterium]
MEHGRDLAAAEAALDAHRGVLAYVWGQPMVTLAAIIAGARDLGIGARELWIFDQGLQVNQRLLTGNHEVVYAFAWFDLDRDGPLDIDLPPGPFMGTVLDAWHRPIVDLGRAGPDRGLGGRYRIVPPGAAVEPAEGVEVRQSGTFRGLVFLRAIPRSEAERADAVDRMSRVRVAAAGATMAPARPCHVLGHHAYDGLPARGVRFYEQLAGALAGEPLEVRDREVVGMVQSIGLGLSTPFAPSPELAARLERSELDGRAMLTALAEGQRHSYRYPYAGRQWRTFATMTHWSGDDGDITQIDERAVLYFQGFGASRALDPARLPTARAAAAYLVARRDASKRLLSGSTSYRLRVPLPVPVADYWSITLYDSETRHFVVTDQARPSIASFRETIVGADGVAEIFVGPEPIGGGNWIQTPRDRPVFAMFRWFGPTDGFYDGSWQLPDFETLE